MAQALTVKSVSSLPEGKHADAACKGLYLAVRGGSRAWELRYSFQGKAFAVSLGTTAAVSLAQARAKAATMRIAAKGGQDVKAARKPIEAPALANSYEQDARRFHAREAAHWDSRRAVEWLQAQGKHVFPSIGKIETHKVTVAHVLAVIEPLWTTCHFTAVRLLGQMRQVINHASDTCDDDSRFGANPAQKAVRRLPKLAKADTAHVPHLSIDWRAAPPVYKSLAAIDSPQSCALRTVMLLGTRAAEVLGMRWDEIEGDTWHVSADRMKSGTARDVPLTQAALDLISSQAGRTGLVFKGRRRGTSVAPMLHKGAMVALLHKLGVASDVHGMRATFRTWAAENPDRVEGDQEAAEICLDHVVARGNAVQRAYNRATMDSARISLLERWAAYLAG